MKSVCTGPKGKRHAAGSQCPAGILDEVARALMEEYSRREQKNGRKQLHSTACCKDKVEMYKKMNFRDEGISASTWGGEEWHDMTRKLND